MAIFSMKNTHWGKKNRNLFLQKIHYQKKKSFMKTPINANKKVLLSMVERLIKLQ
jgi:hypothetical protein